MDKLKPLFSSDSRTERLPAIFIGHGSPMNAIEDNEHRRKWISLGSSLPQPSAILCISAHWMTHGMTRVSGLEHPRTIHDFYGFPPVLYTMLYSAPGSPELAKHTKEIMELPIQIDNESWGLDHGCWVPLQAIYPEAEIPIVQLSIDMNQPPSYHYQIAKSIRPLRDRGVLIIGSGNIVHNLSMIKTEKESRYEWALEFDKISTQLIDSDDHTRLTHLDDLGPAAKLAVPTLDHYLPLLYVLAVRDNKDELEYFNEAVEYGSVSMRSFILS